MAKKLKPRRRVSVPTKWEEIGRTPTSLLYLGNDTIYIVDTVDKTREWPDGTIESMSIEDKTLVPVNALCWHDGGKYEHLAGWVRAIQAGSSGLALHLRKAMEEIRER
jgi:hypothetical protein